MHELGHTRTIRRHDHLLLTPDTFVRAPLPGMRNATAIVHIAPAVGARFVQLTVEFEKDGALPPAPAERFVYVLEGEVSIAGQSFLPGDYAYLPEGREAAVTAREKARAAVFEKSYQRIAGVRAPESFTG